MPEIIQLGPFTLNFNLLLFVAFSVVGYFIMKMRINSSPYDQLPVLDIVVHAAFIGLVVWKFSPLFFSPAILWENPFILLYMSPSVESGWLGLIVAVIYMEVKCRKIPGARLVLLDLLPFGISTMMLIYSLLFWDYGTPTALPWGISIGNPEYKYHPIHVYKFLIAVTCLVSISYKGTSRFGTGKIFADAVIIWGIGLFIVSLFQPASTVYLGLTFNQILYLLMIFTGFIVYTVISKKLHSNKELNEGSL
jgi:hypothetical protein